LSDLFFDWFATNHPDNHFWGCSGFDFWLERVAAVREWNVSR